LPHWLIYLVMCDPVLVIIITIIISCSNYCVWLLHWVYFDLYSAKCVGILLLENLFSQNLPIILAFCSLLLQTCYSKNFAGIIGASLLIVLCDQVYGLLYIDTFHTGIYCNRMLNVIVIKLTFSRSTALKTLVVYTFNSLQ